VVTSLSLLSAATWTALADDARPAVADASAPAEPGTEDAPAAIPSSSSSSTTSTGIIPPPAPSPEAEPEAVTLAFAGDVHAEGPSGDAIQAGLPSIRDALGRADVTVVNLETAVTDRGTAAAKQFAFRAPASTLPALKDAGVDVVSLANNHGLDFGRQGLTDTLAAARAAGMPLVGLGEDEDAAYAPHVVEVKGQRIAVLGATQVLDGQFIDAWTARNGSPGMASAKRADRLVEEVRRARADADTVVVHLHWGEERNPCPLPRQQELAQQLVAAGADVVVGGHAHVLLGGGMLGEAYVDYGLGNFVFTGSGREETLKSGILTLTVRGRSVEASSWTPAVLRSGAPHLLEGEAAQAAVADKQRRRDCTGLAPGPS
jgi:poly-gamma-glutamate capsule biosynthesis protein CapA/YwtB (metallophosphatase superfamily)